MGISYELYNAPEAKAKLSSWDKAYSTPIDTPENIKKKLCEQYPAIKSWETSVTNNPDKSNPYVKYHSALGSNNCSAEEYIEITLIEHTDGYIHWISVSRGSPKLVGHIQDIFGIKYVFEGQSNQLLDPKLYKGNWERINETP